MSERPAAPDPFEDAVRAMLEARADRVSASAPREVLAAVREEARAPRQGAAFAVLPVVAGRGRMAGAGWVAAAMVAVLAIAVLGGLPRTTTVATPPALALGAGGTGTVGSPQSSSPASAAAVVTPAPSPVISTAPGGISTPTMGGLRSALAGGSLDGRIVLVLGALQVVPLPCPSPAGPGCFGIAMAGLDNVSITWEAPLTQSAVPSMTGELAFRVHGTTLVFIGRVDGSLSAPMSPEELAAATPADADPLALRVVGGWLLVGGLHTCPFLGPGATPCPGPGPVITDGQPTADGVATSDVQVHVAIAAGAPGIVSGRMVTPGPFLVRPATSLVVALYDPASIVAVGADPPVTCAQAPADATLRCGDAFAAATGVDPGTSPVTAAEFAYGWYCGNGTRCSIVTGSNGHVVIHHATATEDLVVDVETATGGGVRVVDSGPLASAVTSPAPAGHGDGFVSLATLRAAIRDGSMDGQVVVLPTTMEVMVHACVPAPSPVPPGWCSPEYGLDALPGVTVRWAPVEDAGGGSATWVIVPSGGAVTVLGRLLGSLAHPGGVENLLGTLPNNGDDLLPVNGSLDPLTTNQCVNRLCRPEIRFWSGDPSTANLAQVQVSVDDPVVGFDPTQPSHGTYLVRRGPDLTVVGRYDPATVIRVVTTPVTCDTPPAGISWALGCAAAVDAVLQARPADEVALVTSIELTHGWYCPPGAFCAATQWNTGNVILREAAPGHDVVVDVQLAADGSLVVETTRPLPTPSR